MAKERKRFQHAARASLAGANSYPEATWVDRWHGTPGTWKGGKTPKGRTALFCCPKCGMAASLSDHTIMEDGTVNPSVVCPNKDCTFHEFIQLKGWKP